MCSGQHSHQTCGGFVQIEYCLSELQKRPVSWQNIKLLLTTKRLISRHLHVRCNLCTKFCTCIKSDATNIDLNCLFLETVKMQKTPASPLLILFHHCPSNHSMHEKSLFLDDKSTQSSLLLLLCLFYSS